MMKSAVLMMLAAMAINSCSTSKNVNKEIKDENQVARPDNDMDMDEQYLTLSDAQLDILQKNNKFCLQPLPEGFGNGFEGGFAYECFLSHGYVGKRC